VIPRSAAQREADRKQRVKEHRERIERRKYEWPVEYTGLDCTRCSRALANGTINHLAFVQPYLGERGAVFMRGQNGVGIQLCPRCAEAVTAFARAPIGDNP
jgi:hypothetical protein